MANAQAIANSFKGEILTAVGPHSLNVDAIKAALYVTTGSIGASTVSYSTVSEVSSAGYTAGGVTCSNGTVTLTSSTQWWNPLASFTWTTVTFTTDCVLLYNATRANRAISSYTFSAQTVTAGNFTLTMPASGAATALIQLT